MQVYLANKNFTPQWSVIQFKDNDLFLKINFAILLRRQFTYTTHEGTVDVRFNLDFESEDVISDITIRKSAFEEWLPKKPTMLIALPTTINDIQHNIRLCQINEIKLGTKYRLVYEYSPNGYHSRYIISEMKRIIEQESPCDFNKTFADIIRLSTKLHSEQFDRKMNG